MGLFATSSRKNSALPASARKELPESLLDQLPARFVAVGEALVSGVDVEATCAVVGRDLARDGIDLSEALNALRATFGQVRGTEPDYPSTVALSVAWSDETLRYLHQVSCENPLTGLATLAHLRARLLEVERGREVAGSAAGRHALVVVHLSLPAADSRSDQLARALMMARVAERVRMVFGGEESIAEAGSARLLVLAERGAGLGARVGLLRDLVTEVLPPSGSVRCWIEGLPDNADATVALLDELARN